VRLRTMPELHFVYDESIGKGLHLSALIAQAVEGLEDPTDAERDDGQDQAQPDTTPDVNQEPPR